MAHRPGELEAFRRAGLKAIRAQIAQIERRLELPRFEHKHEMYRENLSELQTLASEVKAEFLASLTEQEKAEMLGGD